jgi:hypothetical protein
MVAAICSDCPKTLSDRNTTGRCRSCALLHGCRDPEMHRRRAANSPAWCPPEHRELNRELRRRGFTGAERRAAILDLVPGSPEHGRRVVANNILKARLRHERQTAEAY